MQYQALLLERRSLPTLPRCIGGVFLALTIGDLQLVIVHLSYLDLSQKYVTSWYEV